MDLHTTADASAGPSACACAYCHSHDVQRLVCGPLPEAVDASGNHYPHTIVQGIQLQGMDAVVAWASLPCKCWGDVMTCSYLMHCLRAHDLCNIGEYQTENFSKLKQLAVDRVDIEGGEELQPEGNAD